MTRPALADTIIRITAPAGAVCIVLGIAWLAQLDVQASSIIGGIIGGYLVVDIATRDWAPIARLAARRAAREELAAVDRLAHGETTGADR